MRKERISLEGNIYNRLLVLCYESTNRHGKAMWKCLCKCGKIKVVNGGDLRFGRARSCGCRIGESAKRRFTKHAMEGTPLYEVWCGIKKRCYNKRCRAYKNYGARGIKLCERWLDFENFHQDMGSEYSKGLTIERINNDGDYGPENCKWASRKEQARNKRTNKRYKGKCLSEWAEELGIRYGTLICRINRYKWGWEKALTTPVRGIK